MRAFALTLPLAALAGCDSLASSEYVGDPLFTLTGTFSATSTAPQDPVGGLALMWQDTTGAGGPGARATTVPVSIAFPSAFRVDVPVPPPDVAKFSFADSDVTIAEAYVFVVVDPSQTPLVAAGNDRGHALVYASADVAAGTLAADYLGGPITAGYHLRHFAAGTPGMAQSQMIARCQASGATPTACTVRRSYQLAPVGDDDGLHIAVTPP
jgi:hypothetical protein